VVGAGRRAAPGEAAFLNGTAGTVLEMDEGNQFCKGHPGMHTVPAALAHASTLPEVSGRALLAAIALGYEAGARVGIGTALRPAMHPHGTWGAICAAVAVARLARRDAPAMRHAINMAAGFAIATSRRTMLEGGSVRNAYAGIAGQMGITVNDLVDAGFEADRDGVGQVFGRVLSDRFDAAALTDALGTRWEIGRNYFKMHSCCRYNHATLDALARIAAAAPLPPPERIARIEVDTYARAVELDDPAPRNTLAARFSVPFAVATALVTGSTGVDSFTAAALANPATRALAGRIVLREDRAMTAALPDRRPARVTLTLDDGRVLSAATETNRGDWADPYPAADLRDKFLSLAGRAWPSDAAAALWDEILALDGAPSALPLLARLAAPVQPSR
jgi:2-methylcitrate dehydratase PrpD